MLSRDTYEEARRKAEGAKDAADALRAERDTLRTMIHSLDRVLRVGPHLRQRDQLVVESEPFADTVSNPEEFSTKVRDATKAREDAEGARQDAVARRDEVKTKIDGLVVSPNLAAAEKVIVSLSEEAVKVSGARVSRPNRLRDLDIEEAKLHPLREMLGLSSDADVAPMMPERAAIDRVQSLAAEALKRGSALETAEERVAPTSPSAFRLSRSCSAMSVLIAVHLGLIRKRIEGVAALLLLQDRPRRILFSL